MIEIPKDRKHVSAAELCRLGNIPWKRFKRMLDEGAITPDEIVSDRLMLFSVERLAAIQTQIEHRTEISHE